MTTVPSARSEITALRKIASAVNSNLDLGTLLNSIVSAVAMNTQWNLCWITSVDIGRGTAEVIAREDQLTWSDESRRRVWPVDGIPVRDALHSLEPVVIHDAQNCDYRLYAEDARQRGYRSGVLLPLREMHPDGTPLQLSVQSRAHGPIADEAVEFLEAVADLASIALVNARKVAEDRRGLARLVASISATGDLVEAVQRGDELGELLSRVADDHEASILVTDDRGAVVHARARGNAEVAAAARVEPHPLPGAPDAGPDKLGTELELQDAEGRTYATVRGRSVSLGQRDRHGISVHVIREGASRDVDRALDSLASLGARLAVSRSLVLARDIAEISDEVIAELIACEDEPVGLRVRLSKLGVSATGGERLVKVKPVEGRVHEQLVEALPLLEPHWRSAHSGLATGGWVGDALVLVAEPAPTAEEAKQAVADLLGKARVAPADVTALISARGRLPRDGKRMWGECGQLESLFAGGGAVAYEDYGTLGFLLGAGADGRAESFIADTIGPLIDYDEASGTDLVATVEAVLSSTGKLQAVARELHIHVSTLRYRLERAADLLGMSFDDPESRFAILLACKLRGLLGGGAALNDGQQRPGPGSPKP